MEPRVACIIPDDRARMEAMLEFAQPDLYLDMVEAKLPAAEKGVRCAPYEIIILGARTPMEVLDSCSRLKFVQLMSAGFDALDLDVLRARGVKVANNAQAIAPAVAEHTILLMLALNRRLVKSWESARLGKWNAEVKELEIAELGGATVGIVGLGHIGREVAKRLSGWGSNLLYFDVLAASPEEEKRLGVTRVALDELLAKSDVVTLHVPLNAHTRGVIGKDQLRQMKPSAILINTCRGQVVDEPALQVALSEGWIAGAGVDVLSTEPPDASNPLLGMENVLVTPHISGKTIQRVRRMTEFAMANIRRVLAGQQPLSLVT